MGNPLDSAQFVRLLKEGIREIGENRYKELPSMIPTFYRVIDSNSAWEEFYDIGSVQDPVEFTGKISYTGIAPGYHTKIEPKEYARGIQSERKLIDDKKYSVLEGRGSALMEAAQRQQEKLGSRTFTNAFSTAFDFMTSEEGLSLCNSSHTTKSGTSTTTGFDNSGTSAMTKSSVAATRILMRQFRDDISELVNMGDDFGIVCPENLADTAYEIVNTPKGLDAVAGEQNANPQYKRYTIIPYMRLDDTDTNNWYMVNLTQMKKDLVWINRIKPELKSTVDFETYILKTAVYYRVAYGFLGWRWIYGHSVT